MFFISGQELSSESFEPDFESTEKNSKEEDYSQLQTIEGDQSNDQESLSYLSNDDTNESIYEDRNKLSHSSIEEAFSRNSIHDTFSDESTFSALNSQEVLTLDQSSYQRSDNDAYSNEEKLSTEGEGKAHNTSSGNLYGLYKWTKTNLLIFQTIYSRLIAFYIH